MAHSYTLRVRKSKTFANTEDDENDDSGNSNTARRKRSSNSRNGGQTHFRINVDPENLKVDDDLETWYFGCNNCTRVLPSKQRLQLHQLQAHGIEPVGPLRHKLSKAKKLVELSQQRQRDKHKIVPKSKSKVKEPSPPTLQIEDEEDISDTEDGSFTCKYCKSTFTSSWNLKVHHQTIHENIRPFECSTCGKSFKQRIHLIGHFVSTHSKVKAFRCDHCTAGFSKKWNLFDHVKKHHGSTDEQLQSLKLKYSKRRNSKDSDIDFDKICKR